MICSYCGQENSKHMDLCSFCVAPLKKERPYLREHLFLDQCELSFSELSLFHTYDLLILLRLVREERSTCYRLMRSVQKAPEGVVVDSDILDFAESEYRRYTARMRVIEGILIDRMGYKPKRVDDKLLASLKAKLEND
ncbi:MAG: hypothetical protein K0S25_399 [Bacillus sp. (in: firmicutes)]|jgi:hypothetical protein|nr:hypothetical protein [Bacillus sp. (in: firmicutes)]